LLPRCAFVAHNKSAANYQRKVLKTTTLSNGQVLPKGYIVEVPWGPLAFDGQVYPDPETFDPLRFSKIRESRHGSGRESAETLAGSLLVGASTTNLAFGFGKHACPGRFIAANMMKSILANLLLQYEIRMPEGTKGRHEQVRNLGRVSCPF
jgi:cytochrome P450